jgi:hypothetical protein
LFNNHLNQPVIIYNTKVVLPNPAKVNLIKVRSKIKFTLMDL